MEVFVIFPWQHNLYLDISLCDSKLAAIKVYLLYSINVIVFVFSTGFISALKTSQSFMAINKKSKKLSLLIKLLMSDYLPIYWKV